MYNNSNHWDSYSTLDEIISRPTVFDNETNKSSPSPEIHWNTQTHHNHPLSAQFSAHKRQLIAQQAVIAAVNASRKVANAKKLKIDKSNNSTLDLNAKDNYKKSIKSFQVRRHRIPRVLAQISVPEMIKSMKQRHQNNEHGSKPPYPYATLILIALLQNDLNRLTLSQIYNWISTRFPYFTMDQATWQNSVRHNLSLNSAFVKTIKSPDKKSYFWGFQRGHESKFFKDLELTFEELKDIAKSLEQYFYPLPSIKVNASPLTESKDPNFTKNSNPLPTPPNTDDHEMNVGLGPAFDVLASTPPKNSKNNEKSLLKPIKNSMEGEHMNTNACSIDERLDALRTPEFKNHESLICSPLTPNKLESIHNSNLIFFQIWNQGHSF
ncbi:similar to Saccharomyces cerevisiae YCR065W HCM1 Forkhead transcription factor that drives S-phase specific expression of genes involved in chromosome segregation [Maudiozyma saulgeensis]|uniref:Similar to Saccharomyces cerevisiae YCR065W HCM1 Forkhead transcription factor that drives S-phase specific expression of genes involved in chromosome segregation n=1 Tax=Maudiozyma saulgeensis TaxID=1789683 RepID=A0A1X7R7J2_9SACH|nr:similar to Saccharomyces cerevisiae YCR065W HCM1 Forkhead transcription factor that drives S-phase specific expression of genes involved in chromosome segregation [Kazachstania saulgeensis]